MENTQVSFWQGTDAVDRRPGHFQPENRLRVVEQNG